MAKPRHKTLQTYQGANGQHGWRLKASNGKTVAIGGETFKGGTAAAMRAAVHALEIRTCDMRPHPRHSNWFILERMADDALLLAIQAIASDNEDKMLTRAIARSMPPGDLAATDGVAG